MASRVGLAHGGIAGGRHDRGQRADALRVLDRHRLGDHPAHRRADQVRAVQPERVEQPDRVPGHVGQRVRRRGRVTAEDRSEIRRRSLGQVAREPDVAVVRSDDVHALPGERLAEAVGPAEHLRAQPHQQQHGWKVGLPEALVGDVQPCRTDAAGDLDAHQLLPRTQNLQPVLEAVGAVGAPIWGGRRADRRFRARRAGLDVDARAGQRCLERLLVGHFDRSRNVARRDHLDRCTPDRVVHRIGRPGADSRGDRRRRST